MGDDADGNGHGDLPTEPSIVPNARQPRLCPRLKVRVDGDKRV
jgi:hypothetical protein